MKDVDEYIAGAPQEVRARLQALRATILAAVPAAQERISYGMPTYEYKGRLVYFAVWKKHIGLYALTTLVLEQHAGELSGHVTVKGMVRLPLDEELPLALIEKLVKAQARANDASGTKK